MKNAERCHPWIMVPAALLLMVGGVGPSSWGDDTGVETAAMTYIGEDDGAQDSGPGDLGYASGEYGAFLPDSGQEWDGPQENTVGPVMVEEGEESGNQLVGEETADSSVEGSDHAEECEREPSGDSIEKAMVELKEIKILIVASRSRDSGVRDAARQALEEQAEREMCGRTSSK